MAGKLWTKEELEILKEKYPSPLISNDDLMKMLPGRDSWNAIAKKASKEGLSRPGKKKWTKEERELVREAYCDPKRGLQWLAKKLDRTPSSIVNQAFRMGGVLTPANPRYSKKELQYIKDNYATKGPAALAEELGRSKVSITKKASNSGVVVDIAKKEELKAREKLKDTEYKLLEYKVQGKSLVRHIPCGHEWWVRISGLKDYVGCPNCSTRANRMNTKTFYLIFFPELNLYKVGITGNLDKRRKRFGETSEVIDTIVFETHEECASYESAALKKLKPYMEDTGLIYGGNTETFRWDDSTRSDLKIFLDNLI